MFKTELFGMNARRTDYQNRIKKDPCGMIVRQGRSYSNQVNRMFKQILSQPPQPHFLDLVDSSGPKELKHPILRKMNDS